MSRHKLGTWNFPSGNRVEGCLEPDSGDGVRRAALKWTSPPPLSVEDEAYYVVVVAPELTRRMQEYLEWPGPALVLFA